MSIHTTALAAIFAAAVLCAPAIAAEASRTVAAEKAADAKRRLTVSQSSSAASLKTETLGSFTPPTLENVRKAPGSTATVQERTFRFTPSGKSKDRKALALGLTSRVVRAVAPETARGTDIETASAYNVDVSVGFNGFALSGGYSKLDGVLQSGREGVDLGLSYRGSRWKTALQASADQDAGDWINPLNLDKRYTVEFGGAYSLSPRLSVMGGVRYQMMQSDTAGRYLLRSNERLARDGEAGAVYLGTLISF